jgi:PAS domain S-box-containing protein
VQDTPPAPTTTSEHARREALRDAAVKIVSILVLVFSIAAAAAFWHWLTAQPQQLHQAAIDDHAQTLSHTMQQQVQQANLLLSALELADRDAANSTSPNAATPALGKLLSTGFSALSPIMLLQFDGPETGSQPRVLLRFANAGERTARSTAELEALARDAARVAREHGMPALLGVPVAGQHAMPIAALAHAWRHGQATVLIFDPQRWLNAATAGHGKWIGAELRTANGQFSAASLADDQLQSSFSFPRINPPLQLRVHAHHFDGSMLPANLGAAAIVLFGTLMAALALLLGARGNQAQASASRVEHALSESEQRMQRALQLTQDGIWEFDLQTRAFHISEKAQLLLGWGEEQAPSAAAALRQLPRHWRREVLALLRAAARLDTARELKFPLNDAMSARWLKLRVRATRDANGQRRLLTGSLADISDEFAQSAVHERYRAMLMRVLDAMPVPVTVRAADQSTQMINERYAIELMATLDQPAPSNELARLLERLQEQGIEAIASSEPQVSHAWLSTLSGDKRYLRFTHVVCDGLDGEPNIVTTYEDLTEVQRQAQQQSLLRNFLQDVFDAVPHPLYVKDSQHRYIMTNRAQAESVGAEMAAIIGKRSADFISADAAEAIERAEDQLFSHGGNEVLEGEYVLPHSTGETVHTIIRKALCVDADGHTVVVGINTDISKLREAEAGLRRHRDQLSELVREQTIDLVRAKEMAERANETRSAFLASMSHELRTPMHAILSFARLGESRGGQLPADKLGEYFNRIRISGERLLIMLNELLDLAKLESGSFAMEMRSNAAEPIIREICNEMEAWLSARSMRLHEQIEADLPRASMDAGRIGQVLRNLLSNAIKFSPEGSCISVAARRCQLGGQAALELSVADEGKGIASHELHSIFEKFVQSSYNTPSMGGTGLGLAICRQIVAAHHGQIFALNRESGGAQFIVRLPLERPARIKEDAGTIQFDKVSS